MQVWSLGGDDPLEEEMVTHSSILAWKIPWTEEPGGLQSTELQRVGHDWASIKKSRGVSFKKSLIYLFLAVLGLLLLHVGFL